MRINIITPINKYGYGITGSNIIKELIMNGHDVSLFPIGEIEIINPLHQRCIEQALQNAQNADMDAPTIKIWHQFDLHGRISKGKHIGFPIFELDTFTEKEMASMQECDELFVCSEWAKRIVKENLYYYQYKYPDLKTKIINLGVDNSIFSAILSNRKPTVFINIGKWEVRKGHDVLYKWFNEAFTEGDNVELWLLNYNPFFSPEQNKQLIEEVKLTKLGDKIRIIPRLESTSSLISVMQQADVGVFPARAEGWNLEILELLACGKRVITTNYSGHTQFCSTPAVDLVDIKRMERAFGRTGFDDIWFRGQGNWAKLDDEVKNSFIELMRYFHKLKQNKMLKLNEKGVELSGQFTWKRTMFDMLNALGET